MGDLGWGWLGGKQQRLVTFERSEVCNMCGSPGGFLQRGHFGLLPAPCLDLGPPSLPSECWKNVRVFARMCYF